MSVSVVIVHFESPDELDGCLTELASMVGTGPAVVVDNSETPAAQAKTDAIADQHQVRVVRSAEGNIGFAAGCNLAARELAESEFLLFANPDARVSPSAVDEMVDALTSDERLGAVNPIIRTTADSVWFASGRLQRPLARLKLMSSVPQTDEPIEPTDWVNGCVLLVRTAAFREAHGFDESYFLYWEDVVFSARLRELGWTLGVANAAEAIHRKQLAPDGACTLSLAEIEHSVRSRLRYIKTELGWREKPIAYSYTPINLVRLAHRGRAAGGYRSSGAAALRGLRASP